MSFPSRDPDDGAPKRRRAANPVPPVKFLHGYTGVSTDGDYDPHQLVNTFGETFTLLVHKRISRPMIREWTHFLAEGIANGAIQRYTEQQGSTRFTPFVLQPLDGPMFLPKADLIYLADAHLAPLGYHLIVIGHYLYVTRRRAGARTRVQVASRVANGIFPPEEQFCERGIASLVADYAATDDWNSIIADKWEEEILRVTEGEHAVTQVEVAPPSLRDAMSRGRMPPNASHLVDLRRYFNEVLREPLPFLERVQGVYYMVQPIAFGLSANGVPIDRRKPSHTFSANDIEELVEMEGACTDKYNSTAGDLWMHPRLGDGIETIAFRIAGGAVYAFAVIPERLPLPADQRELILADYTRG